jgi:uncharacterized protein (TIGR00255 family)
MIASMTGYGTDTFSSDKYSVETEIKSLNSRYLDLSVKLPKELSKYEFNIRDLIKKYLIRGKITLVVNLTVDQSENSELLLNKSAFSKVIKNLQEIKASAQIESDINLDQILQFKDMFIEATDSSFDVKWELLDDSIKKALKSLINMRKKEGSFLKEDIDGRLREISKNLDAIQKISQNSTKEYFDKFKIKAQQLTEEFVDDHERFIMELGILSEKHDVTEECTRLQSHLNLFNEAMLKSTDAGRRLNFICQEMNREVNTINSKSISSEISHLGISIKEELEKIREQVQNIE